MNTDAVGSRDAVETREIVLLVLGCVITTVWVISVLVQIVFPNRVVPQEVHGIMLILVPILFGSAAWQARKQP